MANFPDSDEALTRVAEQSVAAAAGLAAVARAAANMATAFATVRRPETQPVRQTSYAGDPVTVDGVVYRQGPAQPYDECPDCIHGFHGLACPACGCRKVNGVEQPDPGLICVHCDTPRPKDELMFFAGDWFACTNGCETPNVERGTQ